jgi:hypothetical protein
MQLLLLLECLNGNRLYQARGEKVQRPAALGMTVNKRLVESIVRQPLHVDKTTDLPNKIASGKLDGRRILRVVYREESARIVVVTFYPAKKGRYF